MPIPTIEELKEEIYALPGQLNQALGRKAEAEIEVSRLEAEIKKVEVQLKKEAEQKEEEGEDDDGDGDTELIEMDGKLQELKIELTELESKVELEYRSSTEKVTENRVKAAVRDNADVKKLKREILEQDSKIRTKRSAQRARRVAPLSRLPRRPRDIELESPELDSLNEQLTTAENEATKARIEVETLKTKLTTYQMLVQLITH